LAYLSLPAHYANYKNIYLKFYLEVGKKKEIKEREKVKKIPAR
jgi:hypothetical protein